MNIGFVVQRYGEGVDGGAEAHCRAVAQRLAPKHQVRVLTTCAQDYLSWANHFPPGRSQLEGVEVLRFPVARPRRIRWFNFLAKQLYEKPHALDAEWRWLVRQGPYTPALIQHLLDHAADYDALVFFTYLYFPTAAGLPLVPRRALLVPTAHDETTLYLPIFRPVFHLPRCILFNTKAEQELVHRVMGNQQVPWEVVGLGIDPPPTGDAAAFRARHGLGSDPVLLFLGRVDVFKGCRELFQHFLAKVKQPGQENLKLVLAGRRRMEIPKHPAIKALGYVTEQEKGDALAACSALVMPSPYESLSMVCLEAGLAHKPVLVNAQCPPLADYVANSGAGLVYDGEAGFSQTVDQILASPDQAQAMAAQGAAYVSQHYSWPRVLEVYERVLASVAAKAQGAPAS